MPTTTRPTASPAPLSTAEARLRCYPSGCVRGAALTPASRPVGPAASRHRPVAGCSSGGAPQYGSKKGKASSPGLHAGGKPPWVPTARASLYPAFIASSSLNRIEQRLRCGEEGLLLL